MTPENAAPRWLTAIEKALEENPKEHVYQLSTGTSQGSHLTPHVRSIGHRAFLVPPGSPLSSPLLVGTTDTRTPKVSEIASNASAEVAWHLPSSRAQFRLAGTCYVLPAPGFALNAEDAARLPEERAEEIERAAGAARQAFLDAKLGSEGFDWEAERQSRFEAGGGSLRAWGARPAPGSLLLDSDDPTQWPQSLPTLGEAKPGKEKTMVEAAFRNFALLVIVPTEVDQVDMLAWPHRRTRFWRDSCTGDWKEQGLVP